MSNSQIAEINLSISRYLKVREHSKKELIDKLVKKAFDRSIAIDCLKEFSSNNLQSDKRYSESIVRVKFSSGKGPIYIRKYLQNQQIDDSLIETALSQYKINDWIDSGQRVLAKKFSSQAISIIKMKSFLIYRGFPYDIIELCIREYTKS